MANISFKEFYDKLYYGVDMEILYQGNFLSLNSGWIQEPMNTHSLSLYDWGAYQADGQPAVKCELLYEASNKDANENIDNFLAAKVIDGKSMGEIFDSISVLYS